MNPRSYHSSFRITETHFIKHAHQPIYQSVLPCMETTIHVLQMTRTFPVSKNVQKLATPVFAGMSRTTLSQATAHVRQSRGQTFLSRNQALRMNCVQKDATPHVQAATAAAQSIIFHATKKMRHNVVPHINV